MPKYVSVINNGSENLQIKDPEVKQWAKENSKPSYSFSEITGLISIPQLDTFVNGVLTPYYYTKEQVDDLFVGIQQFDIIRVSQLPEASQSTLNHLYLAPTGSSGEYEMYITGKTGESTYAWSKFHLTDTYTKAEVDSRISTATKIPIILQTNKTVIIEPNKLNLWETPVTDLSISFLSGTSGYINEYMIQFTCPSNSATELSLPNTIKWANDNSLDPEAGYTYQISIIDNLAVWAGWEGDINE